MDNNNSLSKCSFFIDCLMQSLLKTSILVELLKLYDDTEHLGTGHWLTMMIAHVLIPTHTHIHLFHSSSKLDWRLCRDFTAVSGSGTMPPPSWSWPCQLIFSVSPHNQPWPCPPPRFIVQVQHSCHSSPNLDSLHMHSGPGRIINGLEYVKEKQNAG